MNAAFGADVRSRKPRISWLSPTSLTEGSLFVEEFRSGMRDLGYVAGHNVFIDTYWADNSDDRTAILVSEIVSSNPDLIVAEGRTAPPVARATSRIPVVFGFSGDPVAAKLAERLSRPGRNLTGISFMVMELVRKRFELIRELLPHASRIAVVANPQHPGDSDERVVSQEAASEHGLAIDYFEASNAMHIDRALAAIEEARSDAVLFFPVQNVINNRARIADWSRRNRIPAISGWARFAEGGNLMTYGPNLREACRRLSVYADRILRGARPADLPIEFPRSVELVINVNTAKALGMTVPRTLLERADRLIS